MEELKSERASFRFDPVNLREIIYDGKKRTKRLMDIWNEWANDPVLANTPELYTMKRDQLLTTAYQKLNRVLTRMNIHDEKDEAFLWDAFHHIGPTPLDINFTMFKLAIEVLGTSKQRNKWLKLLKSHQIFGSYAQTEMGHGSDIRNLETTAVYDKTNQEFVINTPKVSSTKYWIGGLGLTATHCILFAKLMSDENNYGVHPFIVQVRSLDSHEPMKGITVGEIGPKLGNNTIDNGFLQLHNVRVPLENLLAKYGRIRRDGTYYAPPFANMRYFVMMAMRIHMIRDASRHVGKALTIAVRYSLMRRQFKTSKGVERQLLDYQAQQFKILPCLARCYATIFVSKKIHSVYETMMEKLRSGDLHYVKELHSITAGLKAVITSTSLSDIETLRQSCGGHGFSEFSGLPGIYKNYAHSVTVEGDYVVMLLQTGIFILKALRNKEKHKLKGSLEYLNYVEDYVKHKSFTKTLADLSNPLVFEEALRVRSSYLAKSTVLKVEELLSQSVPFMDIIYERAQMDLVKLAEAHCQLYIFLAFKEAAQAMPKAIKREMMLLVQLYAAMVMRDSLVTIYESGFYDDDLSEVLLRERIEQLLTEIRPSALAYADAFGFTDNLLNSAIARSDGKIYE